MTKVSIRKIISSVDKVLRRKLIAKEAALLGIITGIWLIIILADVIIHSTTGNSFIMGLFELDGRRTRQSGPVYALILLFGPPIFVAFRLFLFPLILASRINHELFSTKKITEGYFNDSQKLIRSLTGVVILTILLILLGIIIIVGVIRYG